MNKYHAIAIVIGLILILSSVFTLNQVHDFSPSGKHTITSSSVKAVEQVSPNITTPKEIQSIPENTKG